MGLINQVVMGLKYNSALGDHISERLIGCEKLFLWVLCCIENIVQVSQDVESLKSWRETLAVVSFLILHVIVILCMPRIC